MKKWRSYLVELMVIILGITLSFLVNEWRTNIGNRNIEKDSLQTIYENLQVDTARLIHGEKMIKKFDGYYGSFLNDSILVKEDSVTFFLATLRTYSIFVKTDIGYRELQESGNTRLIKNRDLRYKLIELYTSFYRIAEEWNEIDKQFVMEEMIPYFNNHFPFLQDYGPEMKKTEFRALLKDDVFLNLVAHNQKFKQLSGVMYKQSLDAATELLELLENELDISQK
ncbi:MAG: hypothetical protein AAF502_00040 [Bacteroidota bacterium]